MADIILEKQQLGEIPFSTEVSTTAQVQAALDNFKTDAATYIATKTAEDADDVAALARVVGSNKLIGGDIGIVKELIPGTTDKYTHTAYVWDHTIDNGAELPKGAWKAMDGNYAASDVYLSEDITLAGNYGTYTVKDSRNDTVTVTVNQIGNKKLGDVVSKGTSVQSLLSDILTQRLIPTAHDASYSLGVGTVTSVTTGTTTVTGTTVEVGSRIKSINWNGTFTDGQYKVDGVKQSDAGCEPTYTNSITLNSTNASGYSASGTDTTSEDGTWTISKSGAEGNDNYIPVKDKEQTYATLSSTCSWTASDVVPKDNLNTEHPEVNVGLGSDNDNSAAVKVTGYRAFFYGILDNTDALTSSMIRGLTNGGNYNAAKTIYINASTNNHKRFVVAIPSQSSNIVGGITSSRKGLSKATSTVGMTVDVTGAYVKTAAAVEVDGLNGYSAVKYDVWIWEPDSIGSGVKHTINLA